MNFNSTGLLIAICILISMLLLCHTMNFLYPRNSNNFGNILPNKMPTKPLPTQYNIISYDNHLGKIPCDSQAQVPCQVLQQQQEQCSQSSQPTQFQLSDSELAILYKEAYEQAGAELIARTLQEMDQNPTTTMANTQ